MGGSKLDRRTREADAARRAAEDEPRQRRGEHDVEATLRRAEATIGLDVHSTERNGRRAVAAHAHPVEGTGDLDAGRGRIDEVDLGDERVVGARRSDRGHVGVGVLGCSDPRLVRIEPDTRPVGLGARRLRPEVAARPLLGERDGRQVLSRRDRPQGVGLGPGLLGRAGQQGLRRHDVHRVDHPGRAAGGRDALDRTGDAHGARRATAERLRDPEPEESGGSERLDPFHGEASVTVDLGSVGGDLPGRDLDGVGLVRREDAHVGLSLLWAWLRV